jgi:hypothetical protein
MSQFGRFVCGALLVLAFAGCKQSKGEVCQIDDDCEDGLRCIAGTMRCDKPGANTPDAAPDPDAGVLDASVLDAPVDGPVFDAGPDAME